MYSKYTTQSLLSAIHYFNALEIRLRNEKGSLGHKVVSNRLNSKDRALGIQKGSVLGPEPSFMK